ncbi:MAG: hypothetical protein QOC72_287 [Methylobacteriaceae bacterium]|nr:hypothetical protein [Methylobacteriaceae bacterium]
MIPEIQAILRRITGPGSIPGRSKGAGSLFEMWILLKIAQRLQVPPFNSQLCDARDRPLAAGGTFILRGGPGALGVRSYCHVAFSWRGDRHELHANIEFRGRSTETHEIDLSLISSQLASNLRGLHGGRPTGHSRVAIECKFKPGTGSKDEARQIVARQFDMHFLVGHPFPHTGAKPRVWPEAMDHLGQGRASVSYKQSFARCFNAVCRLGPMTAPAGIFLSFNHVVPYSNLRPGQPDTDQFLDALELFLQNNRP